MSDRTDLSTPASARKALHDLVSEQKRLKSSNRSLNENLEKKTAALTKISRRLSELEAGGGYTGERGDGSMAKYVRRDGTVRLRGEATDEHAFMPGMLDDKARNDWQEEFQSAVDDYNLTKTIRRSGTAPKAKARLDEIVNRAPNPEIRRAFVDSTGSGGDWIPDVMLPQLERNLEMQRRVAAIFETTPMSDKTVILPFLSSGYRPYKKIAATGDDPAQFTSSTMTTAARTITASGFAVRAQVDADASEDSILAALPIIRQEIVQALVDGEEDAIINGNDVTSGDVDALASWDIRGRWGTSGLGGTNDHRKAWLGLRHRAFNVSTDTAAAETLAGIVALRSALDAPHGTDGDLVLIASPEAYLKVLIQLSEVKTLEQFGPQYTALSGQIATISGMPIILSEFISADLATTGLYTGSGATTSIIVANRSRFKLGQRAGAAVEIDKDITRSMYDVVASSRTAFYSIDSDTKKNVALGINWSI
tara:strand:- start:10 stop:1449 length:1440 start_codon:yes stop_codon:yes gene_type:complete